MKLKKDRRTTQIVTNTVTSPFKKDKDGEIDEGEIEEEDRIEYIKRSTREAEEYMTRTKIPC